MKLLSLLLLLLLPAVAQADEVGDAAMARVEAALRSPGEELSVEMVLHKADGTEDRRALTMWTRSPQGKAAKSLVRFSAPAQIAGTALLTVQRPRGGQDNWLYVPSLRQTRRVAPTDRSESFVQSDFTIEDLTVVVDPANRSYTVAGEGPCGEGRTCLQVEDRPANDKAARVSGYGHVVLHIDKELAVVHRVDFYDKAGALMKVLQAAGLVQVGELWRFGSVTVSDVQGGSSTTMTVTDRHEGKPVYDSVFSPGSLDTW